VLRIEDSEGKVLDAFVPPRSAEAMPKAKALMLVDTLRGVVDEGTGAAIRTRYGIQADVAGKTGTTQDNADGWFILMHPHLVAGAWVGFNDPSITMPDAWGPGARSALPIVGDWFAQSVRNKWVDTRAEWEIPRPRPKPREPERDPLEKMVNDVVDRLIRIFQ